MSTPIAVLQVDRAIRANEPRATYVEVTMDDSERSGSGKAYDAGDVMIVLYTWTIAADGVVELERVPTA